MSGSEICTWSQDDYDGDTWLTDCGQYFNLIDGTPEDNNIAYCNFCGKPADHELFEDRE